MTDALVKAAMPLLNLVTIFGQFFQTLVLFLNLFYFAIFGLS
jgi:hypothetical protein